MTNKKVIPSTHNKVSLKQSIRKTMKNIIFSNEMLD